MYLIKLHGLYLFHSCTPVLSSVPTMGQVLNSESWDPHFYWVGLTEFLYCWVTMKSMVFFPLCIYSNVALWSYPQVSSETLWSGFMTGWLCDASTWLASVSQNSLPICFRLEWATRNILCANCRGEVKQQHVVFMLWKLVQEHQALLQFTRCHLSAGSPPRCGGTGL